MRVVDVTVNLPVPDPAAREFWSEYLGLSTVDFDLGWVARLTTPGPRTPVSVQLLSSDATAPEDPAVSVKVDDVEAAFAEAQRRGYRIVHPLTQEPWGVHRFFVRDPDGTVVNVAQDHAPAPPAVLDHVGVVVRELEPAVRFLEALGLQAGEPVEIEGEWVDAVNGLHGVRARMVWLSTPDGMAHVELSTYLAPEYRGDPDALPPHALGLRHLTFRVPDLDAALAAVRGQGYVPISPPRRYEDAFRLVYLPGPEGLLVELAEPLDRTRLGAAPQSWRCHGLVLRPLTVQDAEADHAAVMGLIAVEGLAVVRAGVAG